MPNGTTIRTRSEWSPASGESRTDYWERSMGHLMSDPNLTRKMRKQLETMKQSWLAQGETRLDTGPTVPDGGGETRFDTGPTVPGAPPTFDPETTDILDILTQAIQQYSPEGPFAKTRQEQLLEKKATMIPEMQAGLIGRGLGGTTIAAAIPSRFEQEVAKPWRTETEMLRSARLMEGILAKAGYLERAEAGEAADRLAKEQMKLQEELAKGQITSQEYMQQMQLAQDEYQFDQQMAFQHAQQTGPGAGGGGYGGGGGGGGRTWAERMGETGDGTDAGGYGGDYGGTGAGYGGYGGEGADIPAQGVHIGGELYPAGTPQGMEGQVPGSYGTYLPYGSQGQSRYIPYPQGFNPGGAINTWGTQIPQQQAMDNLNRKRVA